VQTPQRFRPDQMAEDDPLGNHAAVQYDVINHGKDGIGAVSSRCVCALFSTIYWRQKSVTDRVCRQCYATLYKKDQANEMICTTGQKLVIAIKYCMISRLYHVTYAC
jgi:hypothetical protein